MSAFLPAPLTMLVFSLSIITFFLARPSMARVTFSSLMPRSSEIAWPPLGGSAPELGRLRKTPSDPLTPSVQIQADAVEQLLAGRVPRTPASAPIVQPLTVLVIGMLAVVLGAVKIVLAELRRIAEEGGNDRSDVALSRWTLHDLRRTARTLLSQAGLPPDHAEACLGHVVKGVEGIYTANA